MGVSEYFAYPSAYLYEKMYGSPYAMTNILMTTNPKYLTGYKALDIPITMAESIMELHKLVTVPLEVVWRRFL